MRGKQVALHPIGKKLQGALAFFARHHPLLIELQALGDPLWQGTPLYRIHLGQHTTRVQRGKPGAFLGGAVQPGQHHQRQRGVVACGLFGQLLQHL